MTRNTTVVILAGGKGTRLAPYTTVLPKPLMPIGDMPILEIVLRQLRHYGFRSIVISVGHLSELIMAFFGDGSKWGMDIRYAIEDKPQGTIGPLRLIGGLNKPFIVMNGDLLTDIDYGALYEYHETAGQDATVAAVTRQVQISLGVLECDEKKQLTAFREKPISTFLVSMGIYVYNPSILEMIPKGKYYGFDNLMLDMLSIRRPVKLYPFNGLWFDIGRPEDYEVAAGELERYRKRFLPEKTGAERE